MTETDNKDDNSPSPRVSLAASISDGCILSQDEIAGIFDVAPSTVWRAVQRGDLPPPVKLFNKNTWTGAAIRQHLEDRLEKERETRQKEAVAQELRFASLAS
jgi:predicted DNA-binding transcriptional regulator AlpA